MVCPLVLFRSSCAHRGLHSFPTRRSSDLWSGEIANRLRGVGRYHASRLVVLAYDPRRGRSEEHTSELQSHSDLVCRLLLEKKKDATSTPWRIPSATAAPIDPVSTRRVSLL